MTRRIAGRFAALAALACAAGCVPSLEPGDAARPEQVVQPVVAPMTLPRSAPVAGPTTFMFTGALEQGGWIRGQAPAGATSAQIGDQPLSLDAEGRFFAGFDRDAPANLELVATLAGGATIVSPLAIAPRDWRIERIDVARGTDGASEAFMARRRPELAQIAAARSKETGAQGWRQDFIWPAKGRISGRFGAQRIYRGGEPGAYHSGLDIAGGSGTAYTAPADGVVVLAATSPFSLEGNLLIIDHGDGLNSAFLHSSALLVKEGDRVRQGQVIGRIGATGRATGPHLHWSLMWRGWRLDPLLFTGLAQ